MSVNDDPHDWYAPHTFHPDSLLPQTYECERGHVLLKDVDYSTIECPECGTEAKKGEHGIPTCPECGVLCTSPDRPDYEVVRDPKTAGRVDGDGEFIK